MPDASRVQDRVILAQTLNLTRADPDYYPLQLGNAVLGGSFYATRLSIDLRKNAGLVYSVESLLQAGRTRSVYLVEYASDPAERRQGGQHGGARGDDDAVDARRRPTSCCASRRAWCGSCRSWRRA